MHGAETINGPKSHTARNHMRPGGSTGESRFACIVASEASIPFRRTRSALARDKHGQTSRSADPVVLKLDLLRIRSFHYPTSYKLEYSYVLCL